jgi:hypothetical protein
MVVGTWIRSWSICPRRDDDRHRWFQSEARVVELFEIGGRGRGARRTPSWRRDCGGTRQSLSCLLQSTARAVSSFWIWGGSMMVSYTEVGSPERMIIDGGVALSYQIQDRSAMESYPEVGASRGGYVLNRVRGWLLTRRSGLRGSNQPMVMGWVQPPHKIHPGYIYICRSGFTTLPPKQLLEPPTVVRCWWGLGLSSSSYGESTVDTRIYVVQTAGA